MRTLVRSLMIFLNLPSRPHAIRGYTLLPTGCLAVPSGLTDFLSRDTLYTAGAEYVSDLFIEQASHDKRKDLALATRGRGRGEEGSDT